MNISRRQFVSRTAAGLLGAATLARGRAAAAIRQDGPPLVVSTWPFGKASNDEALKILLAGGSLLDAVEQGIRVTESDASNKSVGLSGNPNAAGVVQLDACIMFGPGHKAGSVGAIEGIRHPISAARRVMEKTSHVMLVGEGARLFALEQGLAAITIDSRARDDAWAARHQPPRVAPPAGPNNHDTLALLALGADGNIAGGCSTSGMAGKLPGRVGDSPIIGSGLYVDNDVGAAGATGVGENVMRYCGSFLVVEYMRQGLSPQDACVATIRRISRTDPKGLDLSINFIALDKQGRHGAAGTDHGFSYSVATAAASVVLPNPARGQLTPARKKVPAAPRPS